MPKYQGRAGFDHPQWCRAVRCAQSDVSGDVTPQGELVMQSQGGETFEGHIDPYYVLKGRVTGNCIYDATWTRNTSPRV